MIKFIKDFIEFWKIKRKRSIAVKRFLINQQFIKFYEDLQISTGEVNAVPACTLAEKAMKDFVKTDKDVNYYYKKMLKMGVA